MTAATGALDPHRLAARLQTVALVRRVVVLAATGSTNDDARRLAADGAPEGTVVIAERQTEGRGRLGRAWDSPAGLGLYASVVLRPTEPQARIGRYAIASAVAVGACCRAWAGRGVVLKWPNDVLAGGRKLAGILAELRQGASGTELVIGIGLNVNHVEGDFPPEIAERATSLRIVRDGAALDREAVAEELLRALDRTVAQLRADGWAGIAETFLRYAPDATGRHVRLASGRTGVTSGIDESGALAVTTTDGIALAHASESVTWIAG